LQEQMIMGKKYASLTSLVAGSLVAALSACAEHDTASDSDELSDIEATVDALRSSGAAAQSAAAGCFDAFKTCKAAAAADDTACRDQLKACLPERAPRGQGCSGDAGATAPGDAGVVPPAVDAGHHSDDAAARGGSQHEGDASKPEHSGDASKPTQSGNPSGPFGGHDQGGDRADHGGGTPARCGGSHFDAPDHAIGGCRDQAGSAMQGGMSMDGARSQHHACTAQAFEGTLTKLCTKATAACAQPNAPADVCARIKTACAALSSPDAGI
jgi:hypothetical protein